MGLPAVRAATPKQIQEKCLAAAIKNHLGRHYVSLSKSLRILTASTRCPNKPRKLAVHSPRAPAVRANEDFLQKGMI
jgi:hypothetical protein